MTNGQRISESQVIDTGLATTANARLVDMLNTLLADEQLLAAKTRAFHWNVAGPHFPALHTLFEAQNATLQKLSDDIAEQARMRGGMAAGTLQAWLTHSRLDETPGATYDARNMIAALLADHESTIRALRDDIARCGGEYGDELTADLLIHAARTHEKMAWMLRTTLMETTNAFSG